MKVISIVAINKIIMFALFIILISGCVPSKMVGASFSLKENEVSGIFSQICKELYAIGFSNGEVKTDGNHKHVCWETDPKINKKNFPWSYYSILFVSVNENIEIILRYRQKDELSQILFIERGNGKNFSNQSKELLFKTKLILDKYVANYEMDKGNWLKEMEL